MSNNTRVQNIIRSIGSIPQQVMRYVSGAAIRIFSPSDDDYPKTGVQPYEGDSADKRSH